MQQRIESRRPSLPKPSLQTSGSSITTPSTDLLKLVDAQFAVLSIDEKARAIGKLEYPEETLAIISYLQTCQFNDIKCSQNIKGDFPGIGHPPGVTISGLLLIPLNVRQGNDFLVFFKKSQAKQVKWAGYV